MQNNADDVIGNKGNGIFRKVYKIPAEVIQGPEQRLIPISNYLSLFQAVFIEPLSCVIHSQRSMIEDIRGKTVAIVGAGQTGLLHALLAKANGARRIILINRSRPRLNQAIAM